MFVSFILATFNCADLAPSFIQSLDAMGFEDYEVLVCDGGSMDNTVKILAKHHRITITKSAPDTGIYDAWNCALPYCTGDYIAFLGIDDKPQGIFYRLAKDYCNQLGASPALIYGNAIRVRSDRQRLRITENKLNFLKADSLVMDFSHPGALNNRELFDKAHFDSSFRLAGDLDFYLAIKELLHKMGTVKIDAVQAVTGADGLSNRPEAYAIYSREFQKISSKRNLDFNALIFIYNVKSLFGRIPMIFNLIRNISWHLRGDRLHN